MWRCDRRAWRCIWTCLLFGGAVLLRSGAGRADDEKTTGPAPAEREAVAALVAAGASVAINADYEVVSVSLAFRGQVDDDLAAHLKALDKLATLTLSSPNIDDSDLDRLKELAALRRLTIISVRVTEAGLDRLRAALPECRIVADRSGSRSFGGVPGSGFPTRLGGVSLTSSNYLRAPSVQQDLQLDEEQKKKVEELFQRESQISAEQAAGLLTAAQQTRLDQIQLQYLQSASGPASIFWYRDVVEALRLTSEQATTLQALLSGSSSRGFGGRLPAAGDRAEQVNQQIAAALTDQQQAALRELLGPPLSGDMAILARELRDRPLGRGDRGSERRSGRTSSSYNVGGASLEISTSLLAAAAVLDDLKLSLDQLKKTTALLAQTPSGFGRGPVTASNAIREILSDEQAQRLQQLELQRQRKFYGPVYIFRYRQVAELLNLTTDQHARVQALFDQNRSPIAQRFSLLARTGSEDRANREAAEKFAADDRQADAQLAAILTDEQQAKLAELLGPPLNGEFPIPASRGAAFGGGRDVETAVGFGRSRRPFTVGGSDSSTSTFAIALMAPVLRAELKLTPEQSDKINAEIESRRDVELIEQLDESQAERVWEFQFQLQQQLSGPLGPLRYRRFVEKLNLSSEQIAQLQALVQSGVDDSASEEKLNAILTEQQQALRKTLLGQPFAGDLRSEMSGAFRSYFQMRRNSAAATPGARPARD